jgi:hypothetical protein
MFELRERHTALLPSESIPADSIKVWILDGDNAVVHKYLGTLTGVEFCGTALWTWRKQEPPEKGEGGNATWKKSIKMLASETNSLCCMQELY